MLHFATGLVVKNAQKARDATVFLARPVVLRAMDAEKSTASPRSGGLGDVPAGCTFGFHRVKWSLN
jgi:hypothetical protein